MLTIANKFLCQNYGYSSRDVGVFYTCIGLYFLLDHSVDMFVIFFLQLLMLSVDTDDHLYVYRVCSSHNSLMQTPSKCHILTSKDLFALSIAAIPCIDFHIIRTYMRI